MTYPLDAKTHQPASSYGSGYVSNTPVERPSERGPSPRARILNRPFAISWLTQSGAVAYDTIFAPAIPVVEAACSSLARGALVSTVQGHVAVEDLEPGMMVHTVDHGPLKLKWVGSYDMSSREAQESERARLFRVNADTFGLNKPSQDIMFAPRAHILLRDAACQPMFGLDQAFAPIRAFEDGENVISVAPMSAVSLFNIAFDRQATISVNGVDIESYHPGPYSRMSAICRNSVRNTSIASQLSK
jgi:hypothetical protein